MVLVALAMATSIRVRMEVSGVRSSCEALATNRRWLAKARSRRSSMSSKVSARSLSSSWGPPRRSRSPRFSFEARWAAPVTLWSGPRIRLPIAHPKEPAIKVAAARPTRDHRSSS